METIDLNLIPGETPPVCHVSQFDVGREIKANLFNGANVYTLAGSETVKIDVRKPDNHIVSSTLTITPSSTFVKIITTEQMTAVAGKSLCEISITSGSVLIGTTNFIMDVEKDPLDGGVSSPEAYANLEQQISEILGN